MGLRDDVNFLMGNKMKAHLYGEDCCEIEYLTK